jgi:hypothetical protein
MLFLSHNYRLYFLPEPLPFLEHKYVALIKLRKLLIKYIMYKTIKRRLTFHQWQENNYQLEYQQELSKFDE